MMKLRSNIVRRCSFIHQFSSQSSCFRSIQRTLITSGDAGCSKRLEGKVAIVTGGASGFGEAMAKIFVREGAKVIIADIQEELGQKLANDLGENAHFIRCDVSKEAEVSGAVNWAVEKQGALDVMVNNAGTTGQLVRSLVDIDMEQFEKLMAVNVKGMLLGTKHAARVMIPAGKGSIMCTASVASVAGGLGSHPYTISKHATIGIVKSAASELRQFGIRVNCISPYGIMTPMLAKIYQKMKPEMSIKSVADRIDEFCGFQGAKFEAEDVANAALFLASDDARYVSGHNLVVDGAFTVTKLFDPFHDLMRPNS